MGDARVVHASPDDKVPVLRMATVLASDVEWFHQTHAVRSNNVLLKDFVTAASSPHGGRLPWLRSLRNFEATCKAADRGRAAAGSRGMASERTERRSACEGPRFFAFEPDELGGKFRADQRNPAT